MTSFPPTNSELLSPVGLHDFQVSLAGSCPSDLGSFCFGSEDGRVVFTNADGDITAVLKDHCTSGEAVNGVAFIEQWMSVSTRKEIALSCLGPGNTVTGATFPIGAHGVVAGPGGYFFAPAGRAGLVFFQPRAGQEQNVTISTSETEQVYVYRVIALQAESGQEVVACASRLKGIGVMEFKGEGQPQRMNTMTFNDLDVIDLCPLDREAKSLAAVAAGKDGTLILFRDVLHDRTPGTVKYQTIRGTAYRVLCAHGYLFVLTSEGMYVIAGLVDHFLKGATGDPDVQVLPLPMDAVDANLAGDHWVLIVMPDGVLRLDIERLDQTSPSQANGKVRELRPIATSPNWSRHGVQQHSRPMLLGT